MDANSWLLIAVVALLFLCCLPMLFMRRHTDHAGHDRASGDASHSGRDEHLRR
jgi:hypothetical protein